MKVLVTGVAGQLGHDVMNELFARGYEGVGTDLKPEYAGIQDGTPVIQVVTEGKSTITVTPPEGETFRKDAWYYIVAIPGALENGFMFHFSKASDPDLEMPSSTYPKPVTIKRGVFGMLTYVDQGADQTV